jgi:hypothetical protein
VKSLPPWKLLAGLLTFGRAVWDEAKIPLDSSAILFAAARGFGGSQRGSQVASRREGLYLYESTPLPRDQNGNQKKILHAVSLVQKPGRILLSDCFGSVDAAG